MQELVKRQQEKEKFDPGNTKYPALRLLEDFILHWGRFPLKGVMHWFLQRLMTKGEAFIVHRKGEQTTKKGRCLPLDSKQEVRKS